MNIKEIKEMINLMNENSLVELEIEKDGMRIRLKKTASGNIESYSGPMMLERDRPFSVKPNQDSESLKETVIKTMEVKAPMVGTFYRSPSPESPPYVEVGQVIEPGQVVCIIEAMKLMNEIKSEIKGKIIEMLVDNAEPVEFGQSMFIVEPI
jgi:acetyl-CoA carboxylase biotin carboxyl carrier protein